MYGYIEVFLDTSNKDLSEYIGEKPDYSISIGAGEKIIKEKLNQ